MDFQFTPENASQLVTLVSPLIAILATYLASRANMKSELKLVIAFGVSFVLAGLTAYAEGKLVTNIWTNLFYIFTASQLVYAGFFKALGLEKLFNPVEALASVAAQQAKDQIASVDKATATAVLDSSVPLTLSVSANITDVSNDTNAVESLEDIHPA